MDAKTIISKYQLVKIERNGKTGVQPITGKISKADADYILSHKDEVMAALAQRDAERDAYWQRVNAATPAVDPAAQIARREVDELEAKYSRLLHDDQDSTANVIAARAAYEKALAEWQAQYPAEAARPSGVHYNEGATNNPWTN